MEDIQKFLFIIGLLLELDKDQRDNIIADLRQRNLKHFKYFFDEVTLPLNFAFTSRNLTEQEKKELLEAAGKAKFKIAEDPAEKVIWGVLKGHGLGSYSRICFYERSY